MTMENGKAMMGYAGDAPWHAAETNPTKVSDEAKRKSGLFMVESGMDWEVGKFQLQVKEKKN